MAETLDEDVDEPQPTPEREGRRKKEAKRLRVREFISGPPASFRPVRTAAPMAWI
jgi:hypothetical protein